MDAATNAEGAEGATAPDETLATLVQWIEDAEDDGAQMREASERDRDYYDGRQITEQEAAELRQRNQPVIAFNLVKGKVDYLLGLEKSQRSDPKAFPRTPQHQQDAEAATDGIRYVCDVNRFPMLASMTWEGMIVEGAGGVDVCAEQGRDGEIEIHIKQVHWDRMIWDPYSRERDFSDAKFLGTILWMDEADLLAKWPDAQSVVDASYQSVSLSRAWDDRPRWNMWADQKRRRIRVVQLYWRTGDEWRFGTFTRGGWLDEAAPSYYVDEHGETVCPLVFVSAYVNRDNWRYGAVRDLVDPQDEINLRHRKAVHLLSVRQVIAEQGAVQDVDSARRELAKPDGFIEVAPQMRFEIQQTGDLSAGQASLLQEAKSMFQTMGPNAALLGKQGNSASGRAIALSQQGGAMEIGAILDVHRDWRRRVYEAIWQRIRQFWTAEKWVRVTDDERNIRFVGLNQPVIEMDPATGQPVVTVRNNVAEMAVDIVVEEGQDIATLQIEEFQTLADLAGKGLPIPPDLLIEASNLRNKDKLLERMRGNGEQGPQAPPPELLIAQQRAQLDMQKAQTDAQIRVAEATGKAELERAKMEQQAQIEAMRLEAERMAEAERIAAEDRRHATKLEMDRQIALINAAAGAMTAQQQAAVEPDPMPDAEPAPDQGALMNAALVDMMTRLETLTATMAAPRYREVVRGPDGRAQGVVERIAQ